MADCSRRGRCRRLVALTLFTVYSSIFCACAQEGGAAAAPVAREEKYWRALHDAQAARAQQGGIDLLFVGDSITQGWMENETWNRHYGARRAANFGISGDRTQHVLWRLQNGALAGIEPKVVVLLIGTNNLVDNTPAEVAGGIRAIVRVIQDRLPKSKVLLLGILPRGRTRIKDIPRDRLDPRPARVNELIAPLHDGKSVFYLDISASFLNEQGEVAKRLMPDFLHLSAEGYEVWAEAMEPVLWELLEGS